MTIQNAAAAPPTMTLLTRAVDQLSSQTTALQSQVSSGVVSDSYAGLGDGRYQALDLQPQITQITGWQTSISSAQTTLDVTQTAMSRIATIATNLQTSLTSLQGDTSATSVSNAALQARQSLTELASLLNTKNGSSYVFGGNASGTPPITDPSSITEGSFFQSIGSSVAALGGESAEDVEGATVKTVSDNSLATSPFSAALSVTAQQATALTRSVTVGDGDHVAIGFVATSGGTSSGVSTGSSIRDLMRALAVVGNLDQTSASSAGFATLVKDTGAQMSTVSDSLNLSIASLGQTQATMTGRSSFLGQVGDALTTQLSAIKDSDPAAVSAQLTATQNQLQASYSLIADMKNMSLASYI